MKKKGFTKVILVIILALIGIGAAYYLGAQNKRVNEVSETSPSPTSTTSPTQTPRPTEESSVPAGWLTYKNSEYGFEISYPDTYEALDDQNNLYGWPNGVVLLYQGGQAYDIVIEAWDSETEYVDEYSTRLDDLTIENYEGGYITLLNNTQETTNAQVISTFSFE